MSLRVAILALVLALAATVVAAPGASAAPPGDRVDSVSCANYGFCAALVAGGDHVVRRNGVWSQPAPNGDAFNDISCVGSRFCVAGGQFVAATFDGATFDTRSFADDNATNVRAVSCASTSFCLLVGDGGKGYRWDGRNFYAISALGHDVSDLACTSSSFCVGLGTDGLLYRWLGSSWRTMTLRAPGGAISVACASSSFCAATAEDGQRYRFDGTHWRQTLDGTGQWITSIDCTPAGRCLAIGNDPATGGAYYDTYNGGRWAGERFVDSAKTDVPITDVTCFDTLTCVAVDTGGHALRWNGSRWLEAQQIA